MTGDASKLQGSWRITAMEMNGAAMAGAVYEAARIVVTGERFESLGMGAAYSGVMSIDESAQPKRFSVKFDGDGPESGRTNNAIYELDGDAWRICVHVGGGPAPAEFATRPGDHCAHQHLVRER